MILFGIFQAADYLEQAEYNTDNPEDDLKTESLVKQLLYNSKLRSACPLPFDEAKLWQGENGPELKQEIQKQFRNIRYVTYFLCFHFIRCIGTC
jgi:ERO1-like protein alpha